MLPFLYQTRTLASLRAIGKKPVYQYRYTNIISRRAFSRCEIRSLPDDGKPTTPEAPEESPLDPKKDTKEGDGGFNIRRTKTSSGEVAGGFTIRRMKTDNDGTKPVRVSFSYRSGHKSNTLQDDNEDADYGANNMHATQVSDDKEADINQPSELDIPWGEVAAEDLEFEEFGLNESSEEDDNIYRETDEIRTLTQKSDSHQDQASTITPSEKMAFQRIFSDIFSRAQPTSPHGMDGLLDEEPMESFQKLRSRAEGARSTVNRMVMQTVEEGQSQEEIEAAVHRYPPALRSAAARAMGLASGNLRAGEARTAIGVIDADEPSVEDEKLEMLRKPERDRVEGLMRSAKTDLELWTVMQKEVFSLISRLGLEQAPEEEEVSPKKKRGKKSSPDQKESLQHNPQQTQVTLDSPVPEMSPLEFYGPLYPSYLLLGLRLLDRSFTRPSPLTLSILPEIKSLGIISHVLGAPTQLYNELLLIHQHQYDDFRGVLSLLDEMEQLGLDWSKETLHTVEQITILQKSIAHGDRGPGLRSLWTLPEFAPGRFKQWKIKITKALDEKAQDGPRISYTGPRV